MHNFFDKINYSIFSHPIVFHYEFMKPPYGGANQFMKALKKHIELLGYRVGLNIITGNTKACLFNSFNVDEAYLTKISSNFPKLRIIHRMDGPVSLYRGLLDNSVDIGLEKLNKKYADATVFQSFYSFEKYREMGLEFKNPVIISNASDPGIFHQKSRISLPDGKRKIKLIASSWSDNPKKGGLTYKWLDENLDFSRYEFTFLGNVKEEFRNIKHIKALPSDGVANLLRQHDIYITASEDDSCSNSLIEALSCGLPCIYRRSGGNPELVNNAGEGFSNSDELLFSLSRVVDSYEQYAKLVHAPQLKDVAKKYINILLDRNV